MKIIIITISLLMSSFCFGQNASVLDQFIELLAPQSLKVNKILLIERKGDSVTVKSNSVKEYHILKFDMSNLERIVWTTKEEYNDIYPEDSLVNKDSEHITLWFEKGTVERDSYFISNDKKEYTGKYGEKNSVSKCTNCDFVNITFINSNLASKANKLLNAYIESIND